MRINHLAVLIGLTTVAVVSTQSVQAKITNYQVQSGTTSLSLDQDLLSNLGLDFNSEVDTSTPAPGFDFGFSILPPSSNPASVGTNFTFSYDDATSTVTPLGGTLEHTGSLVFDVDTSKLTLFSPLEIGDFSIGADNSGFFVEDNFSTGLRVFDLQAGTTAFNGKNLQVTGANVVFSEEFINTLAGYTGDDLGLTGVTVGQAQITAAVPEPEVNSALAVLMTAGAALAIKRRRAALRKDISVVVK